jgi:hypothetical protein
MIPQHQTRIGGPGGGNCLAACIASIFEVPIESIDTLELSHDATWWPTLTRIVGEFGYHPVLYCVSDSAPQIEPPGLHIACSATHATVAFDGKILFDPHPRGRGLPAIAEWILLFPLAAE